jgi:hypothetical protein
MVFPAALAQTGFFWSLAGKSRPGQLKPIYCQKNLA